MKSPSRCRMCPGLSFQKFHAECSAGVNQNSLPDSFAWSHAARISVSPIIAAAIVLTLVTPTQQRVSVCVSKNFNFSIRMLNAHPDLKKSWRDFWLVKLALQRYLSSWRAGTLPYGLARTFLFGTRPGRGHGGPPIAAPAHHLEEDTCPRAVDEV